MNGAVANKLREFIILHRCSGSRQDFYREWKLAQPSIVMGPNPKQIMWQANPLRQEYRKIKKEYKPNRSN